MNRVASEMLFGASAARLSDRLLEIRRWDLQKVEFPSLDVSFHQPDRQPLLLQCDFADWNESPPSIRLRELDGGVLAKVPKGKEGVFHQGPHPQTGEPFICMAGVREYHTHPSHTSDDWSRYSAGSGYDLGGLLTRIWQAWRKAAP